MLTAKYSRHFKKDFRAAVKADPSVTNELRAILDILLSGRSLPPPYRPHKLFGEFSECSECHLRPDLLLVYKINKDELWLFLLRLGSHSRIFG
ncbi:MAG: type II toxin-antitoxin system YafQ family toxin [Patescibacteria group bacterium]|nr:type II toxin-antitoxin system YafQ family toxin [Patescibacteria group bacterium]